MVKCQSSRLAARIAKFSRVGGRFPGCDRANVYSQNPFRKANTFLSGFSFRTSRVVRAGVGIGKDGLMRTSKRVWDVRVTGVYEPLSLRRRTESARPGAGCLFAGSFPRSRRFLRIIRESERGREREIETEENSSRRLIIVVSYLVRRLRRRHRALRKSKSTLELNLFLSTNSERVDPSRAPTPASYSLSLPPFSRNIANGISPLAGRASTVIAFP